MANGEATKQARETLKLAVASLYSDAGWLAWLDGMVHGARTALSPRRYSVQNQLILAHCAVDMGAAVATFRTFKEHGRSVQKGQKATCILQPRPIMKKDAAGKCTDEQAAMFFRALPVFGEAQTAGDAVPMAAPVDTRDAVLVLARVSRETGAGAVAADLTEETAVFAYARSIAFVMLKHGQTRDAAMQIAEAIERESVVYIVARACGIPYAPPVVGKPAAWEVDDAKATRVRAAGRVAFAANPILDALFPQTHDDDAAIDAAAE